LSNPKVSDRGKRAVEEMTMDRLRNKVRKREGDE
jgi:hypothetical protein